MLRDLCQGMNGPDVAAVQEALELQSIPLPQPLKPRGIFGPKTNAAVIAFQKLKHLKPDGIVGNNTRAALFPVGIARVVLTVSKVDTPVTAPNQDQTLPNSHPAHPVTTITFPGLSTAMPSPLLSQTLVQPSSSQTLQTVQIKGGGQVSIPLKQSPAPSKPTPVTGTVVIDWVGMIFTPRRVNLGGLSGPATIGIDLGLGIPASSGAKFTASASLAVTLAPELFKFGRFDLLSLSAKAGVGVVGQNPPSTPSSFFSVSDSLALGMSYDLIPNSTAGEPAVLKISSQFGFNASLDHRDSKFHVTTSLPAALTIVGSF